MNQSLSPHLWQNRSVGLLGGSFNPAHEGHRAMSIYALEKLKLDAVWWLVSPQNPLKNINDMASLDERLGGAKRMSNHPHIYPMALEKELGTQYTVDTLTRLRQAFPATRFIWLMGTDNLLQIPQWRDWARIFSLVPVAVFDRLGYTERALVGEAATRFGGSRIDVKQAAELAHRSPPAWVMLDNPTHPASATAIREESRQKQEKDTR